jgi:hypothetical protein
MTTAEPRQEVTASAERLRAVCCEGVPDNTAAVSHRLLARIVRRLLPPRAYQRELSTLLERACGSVVTARCIVGLISAVSLRQSVDNGRMPDPIMDYENSLIFPVHNGTRLRAR